MKIIQFLLVKKVKMWGTIVKSDWDKFVDLYNEK